MQARSSFLVYTAASVAALCGVAAWPLLRPAQAQSQAAAPAAQTTQRKAAPIVRQAPGTPADTPAPVRHLQNSFPVQHNADGSEAPLHEEPAKSGAPAQTAVPAADTAAPQGAAADQAAVPVAPKPQPPSPAVLAAYIQALPPAPLNRSVIVIDPAHGGADAGATIADSLVEKTVDLALAERLRSLLTARGFTVVMTRDSDAATEPGNPAQPLTLDGRASIANSAGAVACLLLHATATGTGVHLYTSELDPIAVQPVPAPWLSAQAGWSAQSQRLASDLGQALLRSHLALVSSRASVRPLDSLTCPALIVELAPRSADPVSINDESYQQSVAAALAGALMFWPAHAQPLGRATPAASHSESANKSAAAKTQAGTAHSSKPKGSTQPEGRQP